MPRQDAWIQRDSVLSNCAWTEPKLKNDLCWANEPRGSYWPRQPVSPMALAIVLFAVGGLLAGRVVRCGDPRGAGPSAEIGPGHDVRVIARGS
jgi:hypothetical protein